MCDRQKKYVYVYVYVYVEVCGRRVYSSRYECMFVHSHSTPFLLLQSYPSQTTLLATLAPKKVRVGDIIFFVAPLQLFLGETTLLASA